MESLMSDKLVLIRWGDWKFENWHLYHLTQHQNHDGKVKFKNWDRFL